MRYVKSRIEVQDREDAYRIYVTDVLKGYFGIEIRYADLWKPIDTRSAEEVIDNLKSKLKEIG